MTKLCQSVVYAHFIYFIVPILVFLDIFKKIIETEIHLLHICNWKYVFKSQKTIKETINTIPLLNLSAL